jgi:hypothetical protein
MRKFNVFVVAAGCLLAAGVAVIHVRLWQKYYSCGHRRDYVNEFNLFSRHSHCCTSGAMVSQLSNLYVAQQVYRIDHGDFAASLDELELDEIPDVNTFHLRGDGETWSIAVPKGAAGNYLLTSDGKLHFNPTTTATETDLALCDFSK